MDLQVELPDQGDNIIRTYDLDHEPNPKGLGDEIFSCMKKFPENIAQVDAETDEVNTYKSLLEKCVRAAIELKARGVRPGDIITPCTHNHLDSCVPLIAALLVGAKIASLDPSISLNDTKYLLNQVKPKIIFANKESESLIENAVKDLSMKSQICIFGETDKHIPFSEFLKPSAEEDNFRPTEVKSILDTAFIFFSSGTTGLPKGICLSHLSLQSQVSRFKTSDAQDSSLTFTSMYWLSSATAILRSIFSGMARVISPKLDYSTVWQYIEKYRVTFMILTPIEAITLLKLGRPNGVDISSLKILIVIGNIVTPENLTAIRKMLPGTAVLYTYAQTEAGGLLTSFEPNVEGFSLMINKVNSVGKPIRGFWYKIVDPETENILGTNERGELRLKGKFVTPGYYNQDSSSAFDSDGWLKTGDICYYDDDRCFFVVSRLKEMLKFRSWHVVPALLEGVLLTHPAVKMAIVIGLPHEEDGDHPLAIVQLTEKAGNVRAEELENYVAERVDDRQRLRGGVRFVSEFPYTPTGKVKKDLLLKQVFGK